MDSKYFTRRELACPCCGKCKIDDIFLLNLERARCSAEIPFIINSGYRCEKHNRGIGSTSTNHTAGHAVDIRCNTGKERLLIVRALLEAGFTRIGIAKTFIHVDDMLKVDSIWVY